jgi:hypothetical protein
MTDTGGDSQTPSRPATTDQPSTGGDGGSGGQQQPQPQQQPQDPLNVPTFGKDTMIKEAPRPEKVLTTQPPPPQEGQESR